MRAIMTDIGREHALHRPIFPMDQGRDLKDIFHMRRIKDLLFPSLFGRVILPLL